MEVYSAKVRLGGKVLNEVPQDELTPAAIVCLRAIHGNDAVVAIEHIGQIKRTNAEERDRLELKYGQGLAIAKTSLIALFGPEHTVLPVKLAGYGEDDDGEDEPEDPKARRRRTVPKGSAVADFAQEQTASIME